MGFSLVSSRYENTVGSAYFCLLASFLQIVSETHSFNLKFSADKGISFLKAYIFILRQVLSLGTDTFGRKSTLELSFSPGICEMGQGMPCKGNMGVEEAKASDCMEKVVFTITGFRLHP